jgi:hypothetical protein
VVKYVLHMYKSLVSNLCMCAHAYTQAHTYNMYLHIHKHTCRQILKSSSSLKFWITLSDEIMTNSLSSLASSTFSPSLSILSLPPVSQWQTFGHQGAESGPTRAFHLLEHSLKY